MPPTITKLRTAFGDYPMTAKLKSGELKEDGIEPGARDAGLLLAQ